MAAAQSSRFQLPGFTVRLNSRPDDPFPNALDYSDIEAGSLNNLDTHREILMMQVMNSITDKPEWDRKVFQDDITSRWQEEMSQSGQDVTPKMMDYIIKELQWKAGVFQEKGLVSVFDRGVIKSDTAIPPELQKALQEAVVPFEDVPEEQRDYHPRSDQKVIDLVHPSLFPVVYGRTRILPDRVIGIDDCFASVGQGVLLQMPSEQDARVDGYAVKMNAFSRKFQWLPCHVAFTDDDSGCSVVSYINNAHPTKHRALYEVVNKILARTIPLWDRTLTGQLQAHRKRIFYSEVVYLPHPDPEPQDEEEEEDEDESNQRREAWQRSQPIKLPEPDDFKPRDPGADEEISLREQFREKGLQVIVKLANIELTPEKPEYEGGSWHIEGQLNERICATAIYYYDNENITQSTLAFRQRADTDAMMDVFYEQERHEFLQQVFGFGPDVESRNDTQITQDLGGVVCQEGRLLTFPNILQHRVSPFSLADRSKPGHRKILALFLIDPNFRVISSANIPPQRKDWAIEWQKTIDEALSGKLPPELQMMLQPMVRGKFSDSLITMDEAKKYRLELMEERSAQNEERNEIFQVGDFSLCEH